jgi:hypothetical protein
MKFRITTSLELEAESLDAALSKVKEASSPAATICKIESLGNLKATISPELRKFLEELRKTWEEDQRALVLQVAYDDLVCMETTEPGDFDEDDKKLLDELESLIDIYGSDTSVRGILKK